MFVTCNYGARFVNGRHHVFQLFQFVAASHLTTPQQRSQVRLSTTISSENVVSGPWAYFYTIRLIICTCEHRNLSEDDNPLTPHIKTAQQRTVIQQYGDCIAAVDGWTLYCEKTSRY